MNKRNKKNLLVTASTYPRWQNDSVPPFVQEYCQQMTAHYAGVQALVPHFKGAKTHECEGAVEVKRFRYAWPDGLEDIVYGGGGVFKIKKTPLYALKLLGYVVSQFVNVLTLAMVKNACVVNAHWILPQGFIAVCARPFTRKKVVVSVHGADIFGLRGGLMRRVKRFVLKRADYVVANSPATMKACQEVCPDVKIEVIPMGINQRQFRPGKKPVELVEKYQLDGKFTVLFVGRLTDVKGTIYLLRALAKLQKAGVPFRALIVGEGPEEEALRAYVDENGLENSVTFVGWVGRTDLAQYYAAADVLAAPSLHEALGIVLLEAQACGLPIVASNIDGIPSVVADGETGILVERRSPEALYEKLKLLYDDPQLRSRLAKNATRRITEYYSWEYVAKKYADVLARVER